MLFLYILFIIFYDERAVLSSLQKVNLYLESSSKAVDKF